jgi:hypothetical protein
MDILYTRWANALRDEFTWIQAFLLILPSLTISQRKSLLTQTRCQLSPTRHSRLFTRDAKTWLSLINYEHMPHSYGLTLPIDLITLGQNLKRYMTPLYAGFLSMAIRNAPYYSYASVLAEKRATIKKEIQAAITVHHPVLLDYTLIFERSESDTSRLAPNLPIRPELHTEINASLHQCKGRFYRYV